MSPALTGRRIPILVRENCAEEENSEATGLRKILAKLTKKVHQIEKRRDQQGMKDRLEVRDWNGTPPNEQGLRRVFDGGKDKGGRR